MYKNRNTGAGNGMRGPRGIGGILYSGQCHQTFRGMSPNILGNFVKHSGECHKTFLETLPDIPGEHSLNILHALNTQIQLILAYISILFQK